MASSKELSGASRKIKGIYAFYCVYLLFTQADAALHDVHKTLKHSLHKTNLNPPHPTK